MAYMSKHLMRTLVLFIFAPVAVNAWWPFGEDGEKDRADAETPERLPLEEMLGMFGPHVVMEGGQFGFDPWEDLHRNLHMAVRSGVQHPQLLQVGGIGGGFFDNGPPRGGEVGALMPARTGVSDFESQLGNLLDVFGDQHSGQVGRASGSFVVNNEDPNRFQLSSLLPGYKMASDGDGGRDSLNVRVVGRRSLVVSGTHRMQNVVSSWQRSFALPRGSDISHVSVTYNSSDGNLTVDVPKSNASDAEPVSEGDDDGDQEYFDPFLPPSLRAMRSNVPGIAGHVSARQAQRSGAFMAPAFDVGAILSEVFGMVDQMHPRYHLPEGGDQPVPEDATVNLIGCFNESQLAKAEIKYYGDANGASFNAMFWHASHDHVPYFGMARHSDPIGHAFTFRNFSHLEETPFYGAPYDGCGSNCEDDSGRWCGCANEDDRGFPNTDCVGGEKRFAVYRIGNAITNVNESENVSTEGAATQSRPYWQLGVDEDDTPELEIVVPQGHVARTQGNQLLLFNASGDDSGSIGKVNSQSKHSADDNETGQMAGSLRTNSSAFSEQAASDAVGKVKLPVDVDADACAVDWNVTRDDGAQTIKCKLERRDVQSLSIKMVGDEL